MKFRSGKRTQFNTNKLLRKLLHVMLFLEVEEPLKRKYGSLDFGHMRAEKAKCLLLVTFRFLFFFFLEKWRKLAVKKMIYEKKRGGQ